jgi:hypothetical protein
LKEHGIPKDKIYVYVANKNEYKEYQKTLDEGMYNQIIIGRVGLVQQREFIMNHFPTGQHIVFLDDDIARIDLSLSPRFKGTNLHEFITMAFEDCIKSKSYIWGVYPVFNPFFRKPREELSTCLNYVVGAFYGVINRPRMKALQLTLTAKDGQKEDVERTLRYFIHDGIVLRYNKIGFVTKYYGKSGGLGTFEERLQPMLEASELLAKHFPEYGWIQKKKTGMTEFKLKKLKSRSI